MHRDTQPLTANHQLLTDLQSASTEDAMVDLFRRKLLKTGAAVTAMAAAGSALGQQRPPQGDATSFFERNGIRIRYQDSGGKGFPLLIIPGGGLNSALSAA